MFRESINDLKLYGFVIQLSYKSDQLGSSLHKVDRYFPSSKLCNNYDIKNTTLKSSNTRWTYSSFCTTHNRDINETLNLKAYYYKEIKTKVKTARNKTLVGHALVDVRSYRTQKGIIG